MGFIRLSSLFFSGAPVTIKVLQDGSASWISDGSGGDEVIDPVGCAYPFKSVEQYPYRPQPRTEIHTNGFYTQHLMASNYYGGNSAAGLPYNGGNFR